MATVDVGTIQVIQFIEPKKRLEVLHLFCGELSLQPPESCQLALAVRIDGNQAWTALGTEKGGVTRKVYRVV